MILGIESFICVRQALPDVPDSVDGFAVLEADGVKQPSFLSLADGPTLDLDAVGVQKSRDAGGGALGPLVVS